MTMSAVLQPLTCPCLGGPFDPDDAVAYGEWSARKLARRPRHIDELIVDVADPAALSAAERQALLACCERANMAVYRSGVLGEDRSLQIRLGRQLGLHRLDTHWLAEADGVASIAVDRDGADHKTGRGDFIPYTDRPIRWHTDGYYQPPQRRIRAMLLHCVRPARCGGASVLIDPELVYIALRDASPGAIRTLMAPDAMTIPARVGDDGVARAAQAGPVFSIDPADGALHMRYTARTRSIEWKADAGTQAALAMLEQILAGDSPDIFLLTLAPGMGIVSNNVLHARTGFTDDPLRPRLLYRARYLDRIAIPEAACRTG